MPRAPSAAAPAAAPARRRPALVAVVAVLLGALVPSTACRVGDVPRVIAPFPDAAGADLASDARFDVGFDVAGDASRPCDLLQQDCASGEACYPVEGASGATHCEKVMPGSAGPSSSCLVHTDCDAREVCALVAEAQTTLCATLCDPTAAVTGCQRGTPCRLLPGYRVGFCVP